MKWASFSHHQIPDYPVEVSFFKSLNDNAGSLLILKVLFLKKNIILNLNLDTLNIYIYIYHFDR